MNQLKKMPYSYKEFHQTEYEIRHALTKDGCFLYFTFMKVYITQLIFLKEGKEAIFNQFEDNVLPLLEKYDGSLLYRVRPDEHAFVTFQEERPYEIHLVSFPSGEDFQNYMNDESRKKWIHLKNESIRFILLIKGQEL